MAIDAEVDLGLVHGVHGLAARLNVSLPGLEWNVAQELADGAHQVCAYSRATRGNIDVAVNVVYAGLPTDLAAAVIYTRSVN